MQKLTVTPSTPAAIAHVESPAVDLTGMHIVVFGGVGTLASAFLLSASRAGARITVADLFPGSADDAAAGIAAALAQWNATADFYRVDVTDIDDCVAFCEEVADERAIDVAIDFAGIHHPPMDLVLDQPSELVSKFRRVIDVNLTGAFNVTVAAARVMVPRRSGQIIHLCSNGSRASLYGSYGYNASKHGAEGVVKTAAAQLAPFGVRVNAVAPGTVITDLNRSLSFDESGAPRPRAKSILAHTPTKRFATAEGVAETIVSMCVPQRHFTGNVVFCDDGYNVEGHSWPDGNAALYGGPDAVDALYASLDERYPRVGSPGPDGATDA